MKLILVRHGETQANRLRCFAESNETPLTETGLRQAGELAHRLAERFRPDAVCSSSFLRARQTGEIIAHTLEIRSEVIAGIHERDFGCLKGQPYDRLPEMMSADAHCDPARTWMWTPPGGESLEDVRKRVAAAIDDLRARFPAQEVIVVTHGAVIQAICAHATGQWTEASVPPNCGIVEIEHDGRSWSRPLLSGDWDSL